MGLSIKRRPHKETVTVNVPASTTQDVILNLSKPMLIKSVTVTLGANTTLNSLTVDGIAVDAVTNLDIVNVYGESVYAEKQIIANVTNSNATAGEDTTIEVKGVILE